MENTIIRVEQGSIADEIGIKTGDVLVQINGKPVKDVLEYRYVIQSEEVDVLIRKPNGELWECPIEKDEFEDLGIEFESGLMDNAHHCLNKCIFCFIDQLPKGMRKNMYFKDDDSRLSFLQGNYITLTNVDDEEIDRLIKNHFSPVNISVHVTDPERRIFMLKNPNAGKITEYIDKLAKNHIDMNFQVVLCKNINDGKYLDETIEKLGSYIPYANSLAIVPFGSTKFRKGLTPIELFTKQDCRDIINQVGKWQKKFYAEFSTEFVQLSDEFYLTAQLPTPSEESYEGYPQLENGVGMITLMKEEFSYALDELEGDDIRREYSIATGSAAFELINGLCEKIKEKFINTDIRVYEIKNDFFGHTVTVSGLMTGGDIIAQLKDKKLGKALFIPESCIRTDETLLLDDVDIADIEKELDIEIRVSHTDGKGFIEQFITEEI